MKKNYGFTLIEMLVVVAVIGILSSVLLTSLGPAKSKAKDARIIQEIDQARTIAETIYDGGYSNLPVSSSQIDLHSTLGPLYRDIIVQGGEMIIRKDANSNSYVIYSQLNTKVKDNLVEKINYYCVDSTGKTSFTTNPPVGGSSPVCP